MSSQQHQSKAIDLFQQILAEPASAHLKYFALECLNEFSNSDDPNKNRVFCQLNRLGGLNQLIMDNLIEIQLDPEFDLYQYLTERLAASTTTSNVTSASQVSASQETGSLDETMNALMSAAAMDTTISGDAETTCNDDDDMEKSNRDKIETIEADLRQLVESYGPGRVPSWLRSQLKDLAQFISKNL